MAQDEYAYGQTQLMCRLVFTHALAQKNISTSDLIKRLKTLVQELKSLEQESTDVSSLDQVSQDLVLPTLIQHRDKTVRSLVSCCIANLLKLYAPEAPFTPAQLVTIFDLFINVQLKYLSDPADPYFTYAYTLLESLSTVRSVILVTELPQASTLIETLFTDFFAIIRPDHAPNVRLCMLDILHQLTEEANVPQDAIAVLLSQFHRKRQTESPAAYKLACDLIKASQDRLQHYVSQYFNDTIVPSGGKDDEESLNELKVAHELIVEINKVCDGVLLSVIPQLEAELKIDDVNMRTLATQVLGEIFCSRGSTVAKRYPNVWISWLDKRNDNDLNIRKLWLEYVVLLYQNHPEQAVELNKFVAGKLLDPDERIRAAAIGVVGALVKSKESSLVAALDRELLQAIGGRCKDKKLSVRHEAIKVLGRIFNVVYYDMVTAETPALSEKYSWIPSTLIEVCWMNDVDTPADVERAFDEDILPVNSKDAERAQRLVFVFTMLSPQGREGFVTMLKQRAAAGRALTRFSQACATFKNGVATQASTSANLTAEVMEKMARKLSLSVPEPNRAFNALTKFMRSNDQRLYKVISQLCSLTGDYASLVKTKREVLKKMDPGSDMYRAFSVLLRRSCPTMINTSDVAFLVKVCIEELEDGSIPHDVAVQTRVLLRNVACSLPGMLNAHHTKLERMLDHDDADVVKDGLFVLKKLLQADKTAFKLEDLLRDSLEDIVMSDSPQHAKYAMDILCLAGVDSGMLDSLVERLMENANCTDFESLTVALVALGRIAARRPDYTWNSDQLVQFIQSELLVMNRHSTKSAEDVWVADDDLNAECHAKLAGLKFLTKWLIAMYGQDKTRALESAKPIFRLLFAFLSQEGEITKEGSTWTRLRLQAMMSVIKLARHFDSCISQTSFQSLAVAAQDPCYEVRELLFKKLIKYLAERRIGFRYLTILLLAAYEPEQELRGTVKTYLMQMFKILKSVPKNPLPETLLPRLLHMLAHHPDFSTDIEDIKLSARYLEFYLDLLANGENVAYLYFLASGLKQFYDVLGQSDNVYVLSDLTTYLIQDRCHAHGWALPSHPGKPAYPTSLFEPIADPVEAKAVYSRNYLPAGFSKKRERVAVASSVTAAKKEAVSLKREKEEEDFDMMDVEEDDGFLKPVGKRQPKKQAASASTGSSSRPTRSSRRKP